MISHILVSLNLSYYLKFHAIYYRVIQEHIDGLVQDCGISSANTPEIPQS